MKLILQKSSKILYLFVVAVFIFIFVAEQPVKALDVERKDLVVQDQSSTLTVHDTGIGSNLKITPNIEFNKLGDFITYKLTLHNNDGKKYKITEVKDDNTNDAIALTYAYPTDLDTADKPLELTFKYVKRKVATALQNITITINLIDEDYITQQISLTIPNTGANTTTNTRSAIILTTVFVYAVIAVIVVVLYAIIHRRYQKSQKSTRPAKIIAATLLLAGLIPVAVVAANLKNLQFVVDFNNIKLNGPYTITYKLNGGTETTNPTEYTTSTPAFTLATPTSPSPTSKYFKGWLDKSTPASPTTPQPSITVTPGVTTGDLVFEAIFQDFYTVNFDNNNGSGIMNSQRIDSGQATNLSVNTFTRTNFTFNGWNTKPDGTGTDYTNEQAVTDLVGAGESITLYAKWYGGNIFYNDNGANSTTKMGNQTIAPTDSEALLWASNFKHSDNTKTFIGWNTQADGNGTKYGPNQTILDDTTIKKIKEENITLYAMWIESEGTMQSWNGCAAMNIGDVKALTDNRDGNVYAIAKLASGKCWMIENLRLTNKHAITGAPVTIDSTNTNNPSPGFALGDPHDLAAEPWCTTQEATCIGQPHYVAINTTNPVDRMTDPSQNAYSYSNHYNFYAATAGTPLVEITAGYTGLKATGDICPAGWRIPTTEQTSSGDGDYKDLGLALAGGGTSSAAQNYLWQAFPNNFILSGGIFSSGTYQNLGSSGSYIANFAWMPVGHSGASIYAARAVYTSVGNARYSATGVRCISQN